MFRQRQPIETIAPQRIHLRLPPPILQLLPEQLEPLALVHAGTDRRRHLQRRGRFWHVQPARPARVKHLQDDIQNLRVNFPRNRGELVQRIERRVERTGFGLAQPLLLEDRLRGQADHVAGVHEVAAGLRGYPGDGRAGRRELGRGEGEVLLLGCPVQLAEERVGLHFFLDYAALVAENSVEGREVVPAKNLDENLC